MTRATYGSPGRCGRCGGGDDVEVMLVDRIVAGAPIGRLPEVEVQHLGADERPYALTVPERYVTGWRCRGLAECAVDGVPALVSRMTRDRAMARP